MHANVVDSHFVYKVKVEAGRKEKCMKVQLFPTGRET